MGELHMDPPSRQHLIIPAGSERVTAARPLPLKARVEQEETVSCMSRFPSALNTCSCAPASTCNACPADSESEQSGTSALIRSDGTPDVSGRPPERLNTS
ncbi:hypothetical protein DPX16_10195 [Anabarilius grahami]|uniref:Uncharacterized protein n=1 Tax=Anabarilius grahami TaxID=495550 RepID=A0A3N0XXG1_ANAGA|nr:hypothetical protein DPX16_10195 [Anabarilius grahami]